MAGSHPGRLLRAAGLFAAITFAVAAPVSAQEEFLKKFKADLPVNITADEINYDPSTRTYEAKGHVRIFQDERLITADHVKVSLDTRIGEAHGDVMITDGRDVMRSSDMEFNIDSFIGTVKQGSLATEETNWRIAGEEISKLSDREYRIRGGTFTTCECAPGDPPSWLIGADEIQVTVDGYAKIRGGRFKIRDVPVLYLPWAVFPVKTTRQSGLLFPLLGSSGRTGFEINLPIYWAISQNMDATFYADYMADRGFKPGLEYRYIFTPDTKGEA
ncbi:MAG: LPS-assembly protein LptD, partial [Vicinamibacteria bacterium]